MSHDPKGDAEDLPFKTDYADRYVSAGSIEYWPDPQRGIKEAYKVLKLGGKACVIGPVYPTFWLSQIRVIGEGEHAFNLYTVGRYMHPIAPRYMHGFALG